nr:uncharacterized protein LOC112762629 [Arachis hypogaea]
MRNSLYMFILHDLIHQVPFFVLEKLFNLAFPSTLNSGNPSHPSLLLRLALVYMVPHSTIPGDIDDITHFTDLSRKCSREAQIVQIYSATELKEAGVKFEVNKASQCLLDLQLSGHSLRIPFFRVEDITEVVLRNLLAFEQCHCIDESYLADYIAVLDFLINTDKDVDLLIKNGIIENWLDDSNAVAKMFNGLGVNIMYPDFNVQDIPESPKHEYWRKGKKTSDSTPESTNFEQQIGGKRRKEGLKRKTK